jgi:hypothetical protein
MDRIRERLRVGCDVAPEVAVAVVAGGLAGVVDACGCGERTQARLPQHVWGHVNVVLVCASRA